MDALTVGRRGPNIVLLDPETKQGIAMTWEYALNFGKQMAYKCRRVRPPEREYFEGQVLRIQDNTLLVERISGELLFTMPLDVGVLIGHALIAKAHEVESEAGYQTLAYHQAILRRAGIALGLTDDKHIQQLAAQTAAWDSEIRRYLPSSTPMIQTALYTPVVKKVGTS